MKINVPNRSFAWILSLSLCGVAVTLAHPMTSIARDGAAVSEDAAETAAPEKVTVFDAGTLLVPAEIKRAKAANNLIEHEFKASAGGGDDAVTARVTMMASGGGIKANIDRWVGQFTGPKRKTGETQETKSGDWVVHTIKISGQYAERMGGGPFAGGRVVRRDDYAMMGAILVEPKGESPGQRQYFVKMIGPESVINKNEEAFKKMVNSVGQ